VPSESPDPRPGRSARIRRVLRWRGVRIALVVLCAAVLGVAGCFGVVRVSTASEIYPVADVPAAPVALVLGAGLTPDGRPSPYLAARLDTTKQLWDAHKVAAILVSGDNSTADHDEVTAMRDYLIERGVPGDKVIRDYAGFDTYASCVRAHRIFGVRQAVVVTQSFHLPRALFLCEGAGVRVVGVAADDPDGGHVANTVREIGASVKAVWQNVFKPDPHFLGRYEPALDQAVAAG
jgi:vancomycin permeability regulator SanA